MIFISAQPATTYFFWQLEIQLKNFEMFGIKKEQIHIVFSVDVDKAIDEKARDFIDNHVHVANIFVYQDTRVSKDYLSSIRPHILEKHFKKHPYLSKENIFYHDSDIVFTTKLPDFDRLNDDDKWYFSDTRAYLDSNYIRPKGEIVFKDMCSIIGIDPKVVIRNDENAGGAQALLKKIDHQFWAKVEKDCENLYRHLEDNLARYERMFQKLNGRGSKYHPVQNWCADMWALLWNSFLIAEVRIDPSLNFCWPTNPISAWSENNIFHNAGVDATTAHQSFYKGFYSDAEPYHDVFDFVSDKHAGYNYVSMFNHMAESKRYKAMDTTFLITVRVDSPERIENVKTAVKYINKYFDTNIIIGEIDESKKLDGQFTESNVTYVFYEDINRLFHREIYNNLLVSKAQTPVIVKYDADIIISPNQLYDSILSVRYDSAHVSYPFDGRFIHVSGILRSYFIRYIDVKLLKRFMLMPGLGTPSYGGCVVLNKAVFYKMGLDNENFNGWGFEDQEIYKRAKILGYKTERQKGPLFHLDHPRGVHSYFYDDQEMISSYREFIKVSNMDRSQLKKYVKCWKKNRNQNETVDKGQQRG